MKKEFKDWLKGDRDPFDPDPIEPQVRRLIGQCLQDALDDKSDFETSWYISRLNIKNSLNRVIESAVKRLVAKAAREAIAGIINPETFIDEVITRIKRKQLK